MLSLLDDVCRSLLEIGFRKVLFINGHGGNQSIVSLVAAGFGTKQDDADVGALSYWDLGQEVLEEVRSGDTGSTGHAGEFETSLMLHLHPEAVVLEDAYDDPVSPLTSFSGRDLTEGGQLSFRRTYDRLTDDGVKGEPTLATAEAGAALFEAIADRLADLIVEFARLD
jgi:creatinine amidohydrolase